MYLLLYLYVLIDLPQNNPAYTNNKNQNNNCKGGHLDSASALD